MALGLQEKQLRQLLQEIDQFTDPALKEYKTRIWEDANNMATYHLGKLNENKKKMYAILAYVAVIAPRNDLFVILEKYIQQPIRAIQEQSAIRIPNSVFDNTHLDTQIETVLRQGPGSVFNFAVLKLVLQLRYDPLLNHKKCSLSVLSEMQRAVMVILEWGISSFLKQALIRECERITRQSLPFQIDRWEWKDGVEAKI